MKYNRVTIKRNEKSIPLLRAVDLYEDSNYWLFESEETFHGEHDDEYFHFKDNRIDNRLKLPMDCVELEFSDEDDALNDFMSKE